MLAFSVAANAVLRLLDLGHISRSTGERPSFVGSDSSLTNSSDRVMKDQILRLSKTTFIYGVGQMLNRFLSFFLLPVFTSYLTPTDYGIISLLGLISFVVTSIFSLGFGMSLGVCYFDRNTREDKDATIWTSLLFLSGSSLCLATLSVVFASNVSWMIFHSQQYAGLVTISLLGTCLSILYQPFMLYLQFEERAKTFVIITTMSSFITIGISIIMVVILKKGVQGLIEGQLMAQSATLALFILLIGTRITFRFSWRIGNELLRHGIPVVPSFAFLFILKHGNKYILQWFEGLDAVGIYTIGFSIGLVMDLLVSGFTRAWYAYYLSFMENQEEARALFGRVMTYYVFGFGGLSLAFYVGAKPVVMIMTQPSFHEAYKIVGLSATAQFLVGIFSLLVPGMFYAKELRYVSFVQFIAALIMVGLNLVLIPLLGIFGAGFSLVLGFLAMVITQYIWNIKRKYLSVQYEWNRVLRFGLIYAGYMVVMMWPRTMSLSAEIAISSIGMALFVPVSFYFLLNNEERQFLRTIVTRLRSRLPVKVSMKA
jgi:O-antigen/teichoic acid export membrane protein